MTDKQLQKTIASHFGWKKKSIWWADGMGGTPESKHMVWHKNNKRKDKGPPNYLKFLRAVEVSHDF